MKDDYDGAEPSGNSVATDVLLRLAHLLGDEQFRASAERSLRWFAPKMKAQPTMAPQMMVALGRWLAEPSQVVIRCAEVDREVQQLLREHHGKFGPNTTILALTDGAAEQLQRTAPFLGGLARNGRITLYECRNFTCELPKVIA